MFCLKVVIAGCGFLTDTHKVTLKYFEYLSTIDQQQPGFTV